MSDSESRDDLNELDKAYRELIKEYEKEAAKLKQDNAELARDKEQLTAGNHALIEEKEQTFAKLQRVSAEFENYQKRAKKDRLQWTSKAISDVLAQFIPAFDNLDSVITACSQIEEPTEEVEGLDKGLQMVRSEFLKTLCQYSVEKIEPKEGDDFDSNIHCAISIQHAEVETELVGYVARPGYMIGNNVIRAAEVIVSKNVYG